ncbi:hypothetical protein Droror1_Dr00004930 [Drosera rotundifolia]
MKPRRPLIPRNLSCPLSLSALFPAKLPPLSATLSLSPQTPAYSPPLPTLSALSRRGRGVRSLGAAAPNNSRYIAPEYASSGKVTDGLVVPRLQNHYNLVETVHLRRIEAAESAAIDSDSKDKA